MVAPTKKPVSKRSKAKKLAAKIKAGNKARSNNNSVKVKPKKSITLEQVRKEVEELYNSNELLLSKVFDDECVQRLAQKFGVTGRQRSFTIPKTLALFVQQMLSNKYGCQAIVHHFNVQRKAENLRPVSTNTSSYCEARHRIPAVLIKTLMHRTSGLVESNVPSDWMWQDRRAILLDGMVVDAPDTEANQEVYPQPSSQKPGLGFPQIRQTVAISLATGVVLDVKYGPVEGKKTGEATQFRKMVSTFRPGDIIVADSNFECYRDLATMKQRGIDMVCDKNGSRTSPFTGTCQGIEETIKRLHKPCFDKSRFTRMQWESLPAYLDVRIIRYKIAGRKKEVTIVTTLLDTVQYTAEEIAQLYGFRWICELDIRSIKSVMGMAELSCRTPEMLERELLAYFLAYNLVRLAMVDAAKIAKLTPRQISFKSAKDAWLTLGTKTKIDDSADIQEAEAIEANDYAWLLWSIATSKLTPRPGRQEPRKIKRRNSKYEFLKQPRRKEKAELVS
jgi:hypothetical protein